jgi:hypothetical protein
VLPRPLLAYPKPHIFQLLISRVNDLKVAYWSKRGSVLRILSGSIKLKVMGSVQAISPTTLGELSFALFSSSIIPML